jgi:hypothetical protein
MRNAKLWALKVRRSSDSDNHEQLEQQLGVYRRPMRESEQRSPYM